LKEFTVHDASALERVQTELESKVQLLIKRERDFQGLVRQVGLTNRWVELSAKISGRISGFVDEEGATEALVESLAEDLGFEFAYARWGTIESQCPPLPEDVLELARSNSSFSCAEPVCLSRFEQGTLRIAYRLLVHSVLSEKDVIVVVVGRSAQTEAYFSNMDGEVLARLERLSELLAQAFDAVRLRRDLVRERDHLQTTVDARTADLRHALAEAEQARNDALRSANARSQFLANMSHEIRTPMTAILGYAELLTDRNTPTVSHAQYAGTIQRSARHLMQVLDDILNLARIESGKVEQEPAEAILPRVLLDVHSMLAVRAKEKGLELELEFATPLPYRAVFDAARFRQVLINLTGNAIKFTERGSVRVVVAMRHPNVLTVAITDTGPGIAEGKREDVFEAFEQENGSGSRLHGGTGLGLAISRKLARLLGGDIRVTSSLGVGSTFDVWIPIVNVGNDDVTSPDACVSVEPPKSTQPRFSGRVLVVDDTLVNREMFRALLEGAGLTVETAGNGEEALAAIDQAHESGSPFDVAFMDMQMPVLDGYEATTRLRARGGTLPVVALTAHSMPGDRERCIAAGCSEYLTKPLTREQLVAMAGTFTRPRASVGPISSVHSEDAVIHGLMSEFRAELAASGGTLAHAAERGDFEQATQMAHRLKGVAGTFGFPELATLAFAVERAARSATPIALREATTAFLEESRAVLG
jgi:signal transduction histidine kinase/DNA-binding response OmpR family regulator